MAKSHHSGDHWIQQFSRMARTARPHVSSGLPRPSRRLEGQFTYDRDECAYKDVNIYVEKGLGDSRRTFSKLMRAVWTFQKGQVREFYVHCFGFGFGNGKLKHDGSPVTLRNHGMARSAAETLARLSGTETPDKASTIPALFPPSDLYGRKGRVRSDDLLIFLCRSPDRVIIPQSVQDKLDRLVKHRRTFWIYLNEGQPHMQTERARQRARNEDDG